MFKLINHNHLTLLSFHQFPTASCEETNKNSRNHKQIQNALFQQGTRERSFREQVHVARTSTILSVILSFHLLNLFIYFITQ